MTAQAWMMLGVTWTIVTWFTVRFFIRVLRAPVGRDGDAP